MRGSKNDMNNIGRLTGILSRMDSDNMNAGHPSDVKYPP